MRRFKISNTKTFPFDHSTTIYYELYSAAEVSFELSDVTGNVLRTIELGNKAPGSYTLDIEDADLADGTFFYTFYIGNESFIKRMVVRH